MNIKEEIKNMVFKMDMSQEEIRDFNSNINDVMGSDDKAIKALHSILTLMKKTLSDTEAMQSKLYCANDALSREGMFTPKALYDIKLDMETLSQLHSKYKKKNEHLIEQGQLAIQDNAKLKIKIMELENA